MIGFDSKPNSEESLQLMDSTNQVMGFLVGKTYFNPDLLDKAFTSINNGIKKYPARLDMRFGKIYALGQSENWEEFTNEVIKTIDYSQEINNKWTWTNNEPVEDSENFFLGNIQGYQTQIYNTENDSLLKNMREISEQILKYYPNHVESLSNISVSYLLTGEYEKALIPLLKAEKIDPKDAIVLSNIAQAYKLKEDKENAIKYYKKTIEFGDERIKEFAEQQIKLLEK
jgi:tetratricopeptide (TPR) repeat protein